MEATQKRGFFKGRLAKTFSRVTNRTTTTHPQFSSSSSSSSSKLVPCSPSISNTSSQNNMANYSSIPRVACTYSYATSKQVQPTSFLHEQKNVANILPSSMHKVSYNARFKPTSLYDQKQNSYANETWGHADENVDFKATTYITIVRERFNKHDRVDSTADKYQEMV